MGKVRERFYLLLVFDWSIDITFPSRNGIPAPRKSTRSPMFPLVESETVKWVLEEADDGILITNSDMAEKAKEIAADQNIPNFKASPGWITKTKRKTGLSLRKVTHTARKIEFSEEDLVRKHQTKFHTSINWLYEQWDCDSSSRFL